MNVILAAKDLVEAVSINQMNSGQVHSVFSRAVNCVFGEAGWMTILADEGAIGPMGLVVKPQNLGALDLQTGMKMEFGKGRVSFPESGIVLHIKGAQEWDPTPMPSSTIASWAVRKDRLQILERWVRQQGNMMGIANVLSCLELPDRSRKLESAGELNAYGQFALERVQAFLEVLGLGDAEKLGERARGIAGFGPGLTPSGDDFLAGVGSAVIFLQGSGILKKLPAEPLIKAMAEAAYGRTTRVSEEMLKNMAAFKMSKRMIRLQNALLNAGDTDLEAAASDLGKVGETSGSDYALGVIAAYYILGSEDVKRRFQ